MMTGMFDCRVRREHTGDNAAWVNRHEFDPASGWCAWGCGVRSDQRVIKTLTGKVLSEGPAYTPEQMEHFRTWLDERRPRPDARIEPHGVSELTAWKQHLEATA